MEVDKGDVFSSPVQTLLAVARSRNAWPHAEHRIVAEEGMHCNFMRGLQVKKQLYSPFFSVGCILLVCSPCFVNPPITLATTSFL